jgi:hypothetical protein
MTAQQTTATAVRRSITVAAPVEKAFEVFPTGSEPGGRWTTAPAMRIPRLW